MTITITSHHPPLIRHLPAHTGKQTLTRFTWLRLEGWQGWGVETVPELLGSPLPGLCFPPEALDWCGGKELARLELSLYWLSECWVLTWGEGTQHLLRSHLEASGAKDGIGFYFLLISVQSGELPLIGVFRPPPISEIGATGAGSCPRWDTGRPTVEACQCTGQSSNVIRMSTVTRTCLQFYFVTTTTRCPNVALYCSLPGAQGAGGARARIV